MRGKGIGIKALRTKFGAKGTNGHQPDHVYPAWGKIIRFCVKQLEKLGLLETVVLKIK